MVILVLLKLIKAYIMIKHFQRMTFYIIFFMHIKENTVIA
jgi:hypothetical protein